jgi:hypothetical protein
MRNILLSTLKRPPEEEEIGGRGVMPERVELAAKEEGTSLEMVDSVGA